MAVTPVGNPYVESSDLVANYPGVSETLAERLDVVGVNPFADSAARATAIPSPVEGQMASLNDDDKVYRYSGSAWVAVGLPPGLNLVAPTSIANSGGTATSANGTTTITGVTSISLNGVFSATYENYLIVAPVLGSAAFELLARLRLAGTDNTASSYDYQILNADNTSVGGALQTSQTSWGLGVFGSTSGLTTSTISGPFLATVTDYESSTARATGIRFRGGYHNVATSYDGITFLASSGNITGTIRVYGYQGA